MRRVSTKSLAVGLLGSALIVASFGGAVTAQTSQATGPTNGITVAPAALKLDLPAGELQTTTSFTVTNHYASTVQLTFVVEADPAFPLPSDTSALSQVSLANPEITLASGQATTQTLSLLDDESLPPGGQQLSVLIRQTGQKVGSIGVSGSIRLPLTVIKESGAVTRLSLGSLVMPGFTIGIPSSVTATLRNTGNMIAIPHGTITVTAPGGRVVGQGAINVASTAVVPNHELVLTTRLTALGHGTLPGIYRVNFSYGLGGDYQPRTVSVAFLYLAWWHIVLLVSLLAAGYVGLRRLRQRLHHRNPKLVSSKKQLVVGKNA